MPNIIEITDLSAPELDIYARPQRSQVQPCYRTALRINLSLQAGVPAWDTGLFWIWSFAFPPGLC